MMKVTKAFCIFAGIALLSPTAYAEENASQDIEHYEAVQPASHEEALKQMQDSFEITQQAIDAAALETVHEASYNLEAAVLFLRQQTQQRLEVLQELEQHVEVMHLASEDGDAVKTQQAWQDVRESAASALKRY